MSTKTRLKSLIAVAALLAVPAAAEIGLEGGASAVEVTHDYASVPGTITTAGPMINAVDRHGDTAFQTLGFGVGASPKSDAAQRVLVHYILQTRNATGQWVSINWSPGTYQDVSDSAAATFGPWTTPQPTTTVKQDYRIIYAISWVNASTNDLVSSATVTPNEMGDTMCTVSGCSSYAGYLNV